MRRSADSMSGSDTRKLHPTADDSGKEWPGHRAEEQEEERV